MPELIEGQPVLIVVDMQKGGNGNDAGIPHMPGGEQRAQRARKVLGAARAAGIPVVFFQEVHRRSMVDFGRELDGVEDVHCHEDWETTELHDDLRPQGDNEFHLVKRRYSGFFGTEFEILLKGLKADTLILMGGLTDVCVHYTFVDAHQHDYHARLVEDCCGGSNQERHEAALDAMEYLQTGARRTSDEIIAAFNRMAKAAA